jgi:hypothetical protein
MERLGPRCRSDKPVFIANFIENRNNGVDDMSLNGEWLT